MGAGDIISPGSQILALTAKKATPNRLTIAKGKSLVLIKPNNKKKNYVNNNVFELNLIKSF